MKKQVLDDVVVTCDPPTTWMRETLEQKADRLEWWVKDFHDFIRDHRSQDPVQLAVERVYKDVCSFCGEEWDVDEEGPCCCTKAVEEWQKEKAETAEAAK